jgi:hypothetical protein
MAQSAINSAVKASIHFWSNDRGVDCGAGSASATCNSDGQSGTFGFTNRFVPDLGLERTRRLSRRRHEGAELAGAAPFLSGS